MRPLPFGAAQAAHIEALRRPSAAAPLPPVRQAPDVPPLLRARLAAGQTVRWGAMLLRGWWASPEAIAELEEVTSRMPGGTRWLRLGGPGSPFTAEAPERLREGTA